jgi:hypothetical protein
LFGHSLSDDFALDGQHQRWGRGRQREFRLRRMRKEAFISARAGQIARRRGMKKAIVALARRLAVIMHRIWVDGTEFRWTREQPTAAA